MDAKSAIQPKPKRGRPRKDDAERAVRRAEILNAAIHLFSQQSYHETTMSDIAHAVGLNQSSLYYWFKDKEDLLHAILQENEASLRVAATVSAHSGDSAVRLYSIVYSDTLMMCSFPFDYYELETVALTYPERFESFFVTYRKLRSTLEMVIAQGVEEGDFPADVNPAASTITILSLSEGLQHQYHQSANTSRDGEIDVWEELSSMSAEALARVAADNAIEGLAGHRLDTNLLFEDARSRGWIVFGDPTS